MFLLFSYGPRRRTLLTGYWLFLRQHLRTGSEFRSWSQPGHEQGMNEARQTPLMVWFGSATRSRVPRGVLNCRNLTDYCARWQGLTGCVFLPLFCSRSQPTTPQPTLRHRACAASPAQPLRTGASDYSGALPKLGLLRAEDYTPPHAQAFVLCPFPADATTTVGLCPAQPRRLLYELLTAAPPAYAGVPHCLIVC